MATRPPSGYMGRASTGFEWSVEPHWDDQQGSVSEGILGTGLTFAAYRDTPFRFASFLNNASDELHMSYQMPHGWDPETSVRPHIHFIPLAAATGVVVFEGQYTWALYGQETPANTGWSTFRLEHTLLTAEQYKLDIVSLAQIAAPAGARESDCLLMYVRRLGSDGADTYAGAIAVVSVDCHFQRVKFGSLAEFPGT